jgi:hypothetical protein
MKILIYSRQYSVQVGHIVYQLRPDELFDLNDEFLLVEEVFSSIYFVLASDGLLLSFTDLTC